MAQECFDLSFSHLYRMPEFVIIDITLDPPDLTFFGSDAIVLKPYFLPDDFQQFLSALHFTPLFRLNDLCTIA